MGVSFRWLIDHQATQVATNMPFHLFLTIFALALHMSFYRRPQASGGSIFFTVNLADRNSDLLVREVAALRDAVR
jgi:hypothetical protein